MAARIGCIDCGGPKPRSQGRRWCDNCLRARTSARRGKRPRTFYVEHGHTGTPTYRVWCQMRARCLNPRCDSYKHYGARGITICDRWLEDFPAFLSDMGKKPAGLTLDRKDNDGPYSPENCRWATYAQQNRNNRRNRLVTYQGRTMCVRDWAKELGLSWDGMAYRLKAWPLARAMTAPSAR